ncbi:MAG: hypothetical protein IMW89_08795 [Ktedonobacteraceae bacterium]|nr:hypothetical protein [Ktedonobacteraceae bacterium]
MTACFRLCAKAHWPNYHGLSSIGKSVRSYFSYDVGAAIDISIDEPPIGSTEEATFYPLARIGFVFAYRLMIEKTTLAGVGLFRDDDANAYHVQKQDCKTAWQFAGARAYLDTC